MTDPFAFLRAEWPDVHEAASKAVQAAHPDPRTACFYARRALELAVAWAYKADPALRPPYQDSLSALIHEPSFKAAAGEAVFSKARLINQLGNRAVHGQRAVEPAEAVAAVRELFHVGYWLARTYARGARPAPGLAFDPSALPRTAAVPRQTAEQLQALEAALRERDERLSTLLADRAALDEKLARLRGEVAEAKKAAAAQPDTHDYSEAETRDFFIDLLLREAGWPLDQPRDREYEVSGMPTAGGKGYVDYVLWGDDGRPLAVVEAKRTRKSAQVGQQQATLYADCLGRQFGRRPVIFYTNGYEHWLWDDASYPPRAVQGFLEKDELELAIAGLLEDKASIPMVRQELPLILEIQEDQWWQDVTLPMLESARKRLRALVKLIDKQKRRPIYTDFQDLMGAETAVDLPGFAAPDSFERFRAKARAFLRQHADHVTIRELRMNRALTASDLEELERTLAESGVGEARDIGLDREAAKEAVLQRVRSAALAA